MICRRYWITKNSFLFRL